MIVVRYLVMSLKWCKTCSQSSRLVRSPTWYVRPCHFILMTSS